jgi:hypothetical protein
VVSGQGSGKILERLWVIDPVGSWSSVQEYSRPLISQGGYFGISGSRSSKDLESLQPKSQIVNRETPKAFRGIALGHRVVVTWMEAKG